jgi:hypothetical protein
VPIVVAILILTRVQETEKWQQALGLPVALTAVVFVIGLFIIPLAPETHGEVLPP